MNSKFSTLLFALLLLACSFARGQNARYSAPFPSVSSTTSTPFLVANVPPNSPKIAVCNVPANATPCTNYATTYNSSGAACPNGAQDTPDPQPSACQSTGDAQGNIGFFAPPGSYDYTVCVGTSCFGPYRVILPGISGVSQAAQLGDTLRFNINGDSQFDGTNAAQPITFVYPVWGGNPIAVGPMATGLAFLGSTADVNPTTTAGAAKTFSSSAAGSTSTVAGMITGQNGSNSVEGMLAFYRFTLKLAIGNTTNARFWAGLACFNSTGLGNNPQNILNSTAYAADSPNKTTLGFRFSAGTDTHWQAVAAVAGGSQTTVDTGITPDTSPHLFEMATNTTGTTIAYLIDGVQVATISTNLPNPASGANSWGDMFWTADNKNTATSVAGTFYYMQISHK